jgi:hypothetical protein
MLSFDDVIDEKVIEACELEGACEQGLNWLREKPKTYSELRKRQQQWVMWMASHKNYPATLELLAKDSDVYVRWGVAANPSAPTATLELLAKDSDVYVRWDAKKTLRRPSAD